MSVTAALLIFAALVALRWLDPERSQRSLRAGRAAATA
jgi:hypothetical protein